MSSNLKEFLLVPNVLGYCRVLSALVAFYFMPMYPNFIFVYVGSVVLSGVDALSAKCLNKATSPFGAVRHLVSDRIMSLGLMMIIAMLYPHYLLLYQSLVILDIVSHWMQQYSSILRGEMSHKASTNWILRLYYNQIVVGVLHFGNELYLVTLFGMYFAAGKYYIILNYEYGLYEWLSFAFLPIFATKQLMNIIQLSVAAREIASFKEPE